MRSLKRLTQADLAAALSVDVMTVSRWERGVAEPSRRLKGRIVDLMMRQDIANHPTIKHLSGLSSSASIINPSNEKYIYSVDKPNYKGNGSDNKAGLCCISLATRASQEYYEQSPGYADAISCGMIGYRVSNQGVWGGKAVAFTSDASIVRLDAHTPVIIVTRQLIDPSDVEVGITMLFEEDMLSDD